MTLQIEEAAQAATAPPASTDARTIPVSIVSYSSQGNVLVVAGRSAERARAAANALAGTLPVTLVDPDLAPSQGKVATWAGRVVGLTGYLGEFIATLADLRAGAGPVVDGTEARFDLVLDFSDPPLFTRRLPPQGYFRAPDGEASLERMLDEMREAVGEFEKPRFFAYRQNICAHQRSEIVGCNACIEICSTEAISADGDHVKVDPHLCMGCGACATVCPSGAMSYQFPRVSDRGDLIRQRLAAYRDAGGRDACILFHNGPDATAVVEQAGRERGGISPRVLPFDTWHVASVGLDLMLPAIAFGASQVVVLASPREDREYLAALRAQMAIAEAVLQGLGYAGSHFFVIEAGDLAALDGAWAGVQPAATVAAPAAFAVSDDKRTAIEFAVEHLVKKAPRRAEQVALPPGAPFGEVRVDVDKCTMCMSCVGACPESALMDGVDEPLLKFVERNCVQCGLCEKTCPEGAISLNPRLLLTPGVRETRILNRTVPFHCVSCGKPFGTKQMVDAMLGRLAGHSMFSRPQALRRLQMCGDCRVVDMMSAQDEVSVLSLGDPSR